MKRFTIRSIFISMLMVAIGLALFKSMRGQPRPYYSLEQVVDMHVSFRNPDGPEWKMYQSPDIDGPYRLMGDDWSYIPPFHSGRGMPCNAFIDFKSGRRTYNFPAVPGVSYLIIWLENRKSERTLLVMSQFEQSPPNE